MRCKSRHTLLGRQLAGNCEAANPTAITTMFTTMDEIIYPLYKLNQTLRVSKKRLGLETFSDHVYALFQGGGLVKKGYRNQEE